MSPQTLKKRLLKDLRAKRSKKGRYFLFGSILLMGLTTASAYLFWTNYRPAALLQQGIRLEQQAQLNEALNSYTKLFNGYPVSPEAADALYRSGLILQHDRGQYQQALLRYLQLENVYPQSRFIVQAQQQAAALTKYRLSDCEQAIPVYQRLIEQTLNEDDRYLYEIADCYVRLNNWSQAAIEFESLLISYPQSNLGAISAYRLADAWLLSGKRAKARSGFSQVIEKYPQNSIAQEARFRLAEMLEEEEHLQDALRAYSKLTGYARQDLLKQKIIHLKQRIARKKKVL